MGLIKDYKHFLESMGDPTTESLCETIAEREERIKELESAIKKFNDDYDSIFDPGRDKVLRAPRKEMLAKQSREIFKQLLSKEGK